MTIRHRYGLLRVIAVLGVLIGLPTPRSLEVVGALVGVGLILRRLRNLLSSVAFVPHRPRLLVVEPRGDVRDGCWWGRPHWADCHFAVHRAWGAFDRDEGEGPDSLTSAFDRDEGEGPDSLTSAFDRDEGDCGTRYEVHCTCGWGQGASSHEVVNALAIERRGYSPQATVIIIRIPKIK